MDTPEKWGNRMTLILNLYISLLWNMFFVLQISTPEDWGQSQDPRKVFVYFFGTDQM